MENQQTQCDSDDKCWRLGQIDIYHALAHWCGFVPHPAQRKIIDGMKKNTCIVAGRRFGKSKMMAALALHYALTHKKSIQYIISHSQDQAEIIFDELRNTALTSPMIRNLIKRTKDFPFPELVLENGSIIYARSTGNNEGKYLRGHNAHRIIIDEAAFVKENVINTVIMPMLADFDGDVIEISTPLGQNHFYQMYMQGKKGTPDYASFQFTSYENPHIAHIFIDRQRLQVTDLQFRTEWLGEFVDDQVCVFKWDSINDAIGKFPEVFEREKEKNYFVGVDIAKMHDYTTIYVVDGTDQKACRVVFTERFNNKPYSYIVDRVLAIAANFNPLRITVDETGVGAGLTEQILSKAPMTEGFKFSMPAKIELINTLKTGLEQRRIKISHDNSTLIDELRYYQYEISEETGGIKMNAPSGKHDDCFTAGTLITTPKGQVPIEQLKIGDFVTTRKGARKILATKNRMTEVIDKYGFTGTPTHPFFTKKGLRELSILKATDITYIWNPTTSSIEERRIGDIRNQSDGNSGFITGTMENGKNRQSHSIDRYGLTTLDQSRGGMSFTTKTITSSTIKSSTSKLCREVSTLPNMQLLKCDGGQASISKRTMERYGKYYRLVGGKVINSENMERKTQDFSQQSKRIERVYNIQVDGEPEYFANFVLVHNCVIALALAYWKCAVIYADVGVTLIPAEGKALNTAETSVLTVQDPDNANSNSSVVVI